MLGEDAALSRAECSWLTELNRLWSFVLQADSSQDLWRVAASSSGIDAPGYASLNLSTASRRTFGFGSSGSLVMALTSSCDLLREDMKQGRLRSSMLRKPSPPKRTGRVACCQAVSSSPTLVTLVVVSLTRLSMDARQLGR